MSVWSLLLLNDSRQAAYYRAICILKEHYNTNFTSLPPKIKKLGHLPLTTLREIIKLINNLAVKQINGSNYFALLYKNYYLHIMINM